jgi:hypothetical protein
MVIIMIIVYGLIFVVSGLKSDIRHFSSSFSRARLSRVYQRPPVVSDTCKVEYNKVIFEGDGYNIRIADGNRDIPSCSVFLSEQMYAGMPKGQQRELARLEQNDLTRRYARKRLGKRTLPGALIIAEEVCLNYIQLH